MKTPDASSERNTPYLSVVVGSHNAQTTIGKCLTEIDNQRAGYDVELIVVDNSSDSSPELVSNQFESVKFLSASETLYVPELWALGIKKSRGEVVAITTAHCVPDANWIKRIIESHKTASAGFGGAVELAPSTGPVEWAIYFCRYSKYMLPFEAGLDHDIAGDNASYKREVLDKYEKIWSDGFWEPTVHAAMLKDGYQLYRCPDIVVFHTRSFSTVKFTRNRFDHGLQHGLDRARGVNRIHAFVYFLRTPIVPFVLVARVGKRVFEKRRQRMRFIVSLPLLFLFFVCWSLGEGKGSLMGFLR